MGRNKKKSQVVGSMIIKDRFAKKNPHRSSDSFVSDSYTGHEFFSVT